MPLDFYMLFASPDHGNAIDACCACGKGKDFGQSAWKYPNYEPPEEDNEEPKPWGMPPGVGACEKLGNRNP